MWDIRKWIRIHILCNEKTVWGRIINLELLRFTNSPLVYDNVFDTQCTNDSPPHISLWDGNKPASNEKLSEAMGRTEPHLYGFRNHWERSSRGHDCQVTQSWTQAIRGSSPLPLCLECGFHFLSCSQKPPQGHSLETAIMVLRPSRWCLWLNPVKASV